MYRVLQGSANAVDATYKAGADMKRGMLVVKGTDGTVDFTTTATDKNVFLVGGEYAIAGALGDVDVPDYADEYETVKENDLVVLEKPVAPGVYFTDQATGTFTVGKYALVGTEGKLVPTNTASKFVIKDTKYSDCGRSETGIVFEVLD